MSLDPQINKCSNTISLICYVLLCFNLLFKYFSHVLCKSLSSSQTPYWINYKVALRDYWTLEVTLTVCPHGARVGPCANRPWQKWLLCYFADEAVDVRVSVGSWEYLSMGSLVLCAASPCRWPPQPTEVTWGADLPCAVHPWCDYCSGKSLNATSWGPDPEHSRVAPRFLTLSICGIQSVLFPAAKFWDGLRIAIGN